MKKNLTYLQFYNECMETGRMPCAGLCLQFKGTKAFDLVNPEYEYEGGDGTYWGCEDGDGWFKDSDALKFRFGPVRQTVVLLCAAINNEL